MNINTYKNLRTIYAARDITKHDIAFTCLQIQTAYREKELDTTIEFKPEPITEGGIVFVFDKPNMYKCIRFQHNGRFWPCVNDENWLHDTTSIFPTGTKINLFLKAFYDAPSWSKAEIDIFLKALSNNGFVTKAPLKGSKRMRLVTEL